MRIRTTVVLITLFQPFMPSVRNKFSPKLNSFNEKFGSVVHYLFSFDVRLRFGRIAYFIDVVLYMAFLCTITAYSLVAPVLFGDGYWDKTNQKLSSCPLFNLTAEPYLNDYVYYDEKVIDSFNHWFIGDDFDMIIIFPPPPQFLTYNIIHKCLLCRSHFNRIHNSKSIYSCKEKQTCSVKIEWTETTVAICHGDLRHWLVFSKGNYFSDC